jgi:polyhydroxyalkanoate synthesis regulator phasin
MSAPLRDNNSKEPDGDSVDGIVDDAEVGVIRAALSDEDREHVFHAYYDEGHLSREEAKRFLGADNLKTAEENARGAEHLFDGDTSRFLE